MIIWINWVYRISYRQRIWIAFIVVLSAAIAVMGILSYYIAARVAENNAILLNQETVSKAAQALEEKLNHVKMSVLSMTLNSNYRKAVGLDILSAPLNYYNFLSIMQDTFTQLKLIEPLIDSILVATPDGDFYITTQKRQADYPFYGSAIHERILNEPGYHREIWQEQHQDPFFQDKAQVISFVTEGVMNDLSRNVFVVVNVKVSKLREYVTGNLNSSQGYYILLSDDGKEIIRTETAFPIDPVDNRAFQQVLGSEQGGFEYGSGEQTSIVNYKRMATKNGGTLFSVLSKSQFLKQLDAIKWLISVVIIGCLLLSILFADLLTRWLLRPLNYFRQLMKHVENNDLDVRYTSRYEDEISHLGNQFNRMLEQIQRLIADVTEAEQQKHRMEIKVLQAQINPHFLYNTLNTIYWKSQMKQQQDVQHLVLAMSRLFQLGLNGGYELTTLRDELQHVEQYLLIQQQCYEQLFVYELELAAGIDGSKPILKVVLQPLVENAILHGFKDRNEGGWIGIRVYRDGQFLFITVADNGRGLKGTLAAAGGRTDGSGQRVHSGFALNNVRQRLQLQYGIEAGLRLDNRPEGGVCATIGIPLSQFGKPFD